MENFSTIVTVQNFHKFKSKLWKEHIIYYFQLANKISCDQVLRILALHILLSLITNNINRIYYNPRNIES